MSDEPRTCSIDADPLKADFVARRHLAGDTYAAMERAAKASGIPMKRETIAKHLKECIGTAKKGPVVAQAAAKTKTPAKGAPDVAVLVQKQVVEKLEAGEARVTVQHGLQAQQLLDKRAERAKDRELAVTLARLLHAPAPSPEQVRHRQVDAGSGEEIIEGTAVEI